MADNQLTTTSGSESQANTQSPQAAGAGVTGSVQSGSVQPGTATSLLNGGQNGVPLNGSALSTVSLNTPPQAATASVIKAAIPKQNHHVNSVFLAFPALLILVAAIAFWLTSRSEKTTT